jgi:GNAT superfamily N-acetyltransferase
VTLQPAIAADASAVAALLTAAANTLTVQYGTGHWSQASSDRSVLNAMRTSRVYLVRDSGLTIATLALATRKPWAIDTKYFTPRGTALYLLSMAVDPQQQGRGIGRQCVEQAMTICREWPSETIRLDAYDATAGAGAFYAKCGFREVGRVVYRTVPLIYFEWLA